MSTLSQTNLTLEEIKDLITFCKSNGISYLEYQTLKFNLVPEIPEVRQPTTDELLYGNFNSWTGSPRDVK